MFRQVPPSHAPPLPLLITGVAGVAGYNALSYFQAKYPGQVFGIRQRDKWRLSGPGVVACNAEDREGLQRLFD
jgi:dTDP-4-dehydrorhamnose reductase